MERNELIPDNTHDNFELGMRFRQWKQVAEYRDAFTATVTEIRATNRLFDLIKDIQRVTK